MKTVKLTALFMAASLMLGMACSPKEENKMAPEREWIETTTWNDSMMEAYLRPYWYTREIYNETATFVGEDGEATLLFTPTEVHSVRDYQLGITYVEGRDYIIEGNKIKRVKGGNMPYWKEDEYFMKTPGAIAIPADKAECEFDFDETRYLFYGEGTTVTCKQVAITYRHAEAYNGPAMEYQGEKLTPFLQKIENGEDVNVMVYGDSVAVGCNASGTSYGGNVNPYMPDFANIVKQYIEKNYSVNVNLENMAVGGWKVSDCIQNYDARIKSKNIDLMILRIGGNDGDASEGRYSYEMTTLISSFFADYPNACLIVQTPEVANRQSTWKLNVGEIGGWTENIVSEHPFSDRIAIARVQDFTQWVESRGKRTRDWLANNVNHANDFMIRAYAQILLQTMFGNEYSGR